MIVLFLLWGCAKPETAAEACGRAQSAAVECGIEPLDCADWLPRWQEATGCPDEVAAEYAGCLADEAETCSPAYGLHCDWYQSICG